VELTKHIGHRRSKATSTGSARSPIVLSDVRSCAVCSVVSTFVVDEAKAALVRPAVTGGMCASAIWAFTKQGLDKERLFCTSTNRSLADKQQDDSWRP